MKTMEQKFMELYEENEKEVINLREEVETYKRKYVYNILDDSKLSIDKSNEFIFNDQLKIFFTSRLNSRSYTRDEVLKYIVKYLKINNLLSFDDVYNSLKFNVNSIIDELLRFNSSSYYALCDIKKYSIIAEFKLNGVKYIMEDDSTCNEFSSLNLFNTKDLAYNDLREELNKFINNDDNYKFIKEKFENDCNNE